EHHQRLPN
ncbi:AMP-binding enzyme family protein, partial [Vibrio parahaemolyticus V-223/04]